MLLKRLECSSCAVSSDGLIVLFCIICKSFLLFVLEYSEDMEQFMGVV